MIVDLPDDLGEALIRSGVARPVDDETVEFLSAGVPIEMNEADMAALLDIGADALRKRRERGLCEGLYRKSGREILYSTPLTLRAFHLL